MADIYDRKKRSDIMRRIRSRDTKPEMQVRSALHQLGYRFRLHRSDLPGKPDIVLPKWRTVILVHGCFWHGHDCCEGHHPKTNSKYWIPKLLSNRRRDAENIMRLSQLGWRWLVIWECETYSLKKLQKRLLRSIGLCAEGSPVARAIRRAVV
jgi:DNA mismatch endonuclease (patch repair protein)